MAQIVETNTKTFAASAAIGKHERVKIESAGTIAQAGLAEKEIGTALNEAYAAGDNVAVHLSSAAGTCKMIAIEAISVASAVYTETDGKIQDTAQATAYLVGIALEEATADGDVIEVLRNSHGDTAAT